MKMGFLLLLYVEMCPAEWGEDAIHFEFNQFMFFFVHNCLNKQKSWMTALLIAMGMENVSQATATASQDSLVLIVQKVISY